MNIQFAIALRSRAAYSLDFRSVHRAGGIEGVLREARGGCASIDRKVVLYRSSRTAYTTREVDIDFGDPMWQDRVRDAFRSISADRR